MTYCKTCNAAHNNDPARIIRCMGCVYRYDGSPPTKWKSLVGLGQGDSFVARLGDVDECVPGFASGADEEASVTVNLGRDGPEQDAKATSATGPHTNDGTA